MDRTYTYQGYMPYGAGEIFCLDTFVDDDFCGNVTAQIIAEGIGAFHICTENTAELVLPSYTLPFVKR